MGGAIRDHLKTSVTSSAAPYGYTLTIWGSGAVATGQLGEPGVYEALLLMGGAVLGFVVVEAVAYGSIRVRPSAGAPPTIAVWGNAHILSAGGGIGGVWAILHAVGTRVGWALAGFTATTIYLVANAIQTTLATQTDADDS